MLTAAQQEAREGKIGASFIPKLMAGDEEAIGREWQRLVGHPAYKELDLSLQWGPAFGSFIEPFVLDWHEKKTGQPITDRGVWVNYPEPAFDYVGCTLDGYRCADNTCIDAKQWSRWASLQDCLETYPGQLVVQKACTRAARAALLVCHGGDEPSEHEVRWTQEYEAEVWHRIQWFWHQVETLEPPCKLPGIKPQLINAVRVVDMGTSNQWMSWAAEWLSNRNAAQTFKAAEKELKTMIEADVKEAFGGGIKAIRNRAGSVSIKAAA